MQKMLAATVDGLGFSTRVQNVLDGMRVVTIGDLVALSDRELLRSPNLGRKSLSEIHQVLGARGLCLGMRREAAEPGTGEVVIPGEELDRLIARSVARRIRFLERASRDGCSSADVHLGRIYLEGVGVRTSFRKARVYFARAARRGNRLGYWNLAVLDQTGYGVRRSPAKAARWMEAYRRRSGGVQ